MNDRTDGELLADWIGGRKTEAMAELFRRYTPRLYTVALSVLRDPAAAEDAVQAVFIRVLALKEAPDLFKAWIYRSVHNQAVQLLRERRRRTEREEEARRQQPEGSMADPTNEAEMRAWLEREVGAMEADLREPFLLRYQHDLTFDEIAEVLERPKGTVSRQVFEARERLKKLAVALGAIGAMQLDALAAGVPLKTPPATLERRLAEGLGRAAGRTGAGSLPLKILLTTASLAVVIGGVASLTGSWGAASPAASLLSRVGPAEAPAEAPALPAETTSMMDSLLGQAGEADGLVRRCEAILRVRIPDFIDPGSLTIGGEPGLGLESLSRRRDGPSSEEPDVDWDERGLLVVTFRCFERTVFRVTAETRTSLGYSVTFVAGPGETVDLPWSEFRHKDRTEWSVILQELPRQKQFGIVTLKFDGTSLNRIADDDSGREIVHDRTEEGTLRILAPAGRRRLRFEHLGGVQTLPLDVEGGKIVEAAPLVEVIGSGAVAGIVLDGEGRPVVDAMVWLTDSGGAGRSAMGATNGEGRFRIGGLDPAFPGLRLNVQAGGHPHVTVDPVALGSVDLVVRLPRALRFAVRICRPDGMTMPGWVTVAERRPGREGAAGDRASGEPPTLALDEEEFPAGTEVRLQVGAWRFRTLITDWIRLHRDGEVTVVLDPEETEED